MIYELEKKDYFKIEKLLNTNLINLEIKSIVYGFNPGCIFVDNINNPKTAMIWSKGIEGFYFVGEENNTEFNEYINKYIDDNIHKHAVKYNLKSYEFSGTSNKWDQTFEKMFDNRDMYISKQYVYKNSKNKNNLIKNLSLNKDYSVHIVNRNLLQNNTYDLGLVRAIILDYWDSFEDYCKQGMGVCITHNSTAVCACLTSFKTNDTMESHIITSQNYRKKGLATFAVGQFVKEAKSAGYNLYWDCMEKNFGSRALAEKHNYTKAFEYKLYEFNFK